MLAFRSLDPFRALREPDRSRRDEERLSRSEQRTLSKTQNNHLTGKAPYKSAANLTSEGVAGLAPRLWLSMPNSRALPAGHEVLWRATEAGALRGGIGQSGVPV